MGVQQPTSAGVLRVNAQAQSGSGRERPRRRLTHMTDDFDFDFDVDRGRSASRTDGRPRGPRRHRGPSRRQWAHGNGNGARAKGSSGPTAGQRPRGYAARARQLLDRRGELLYADEEETATTRLRRAARPKPPEPKSPRRSGEADDDDWLSLGDDDFEPGSLSPLRERDDGPAGPPTPGEARNFAKEARRRASSAPARFSTSTWSASAWSARGPGARMTTSSPCSARSPRRAASRAGAPPSGTPSHSGVQGLRRVGSERIAESRDRVRPCASGSPHGYRSRGPRRGAGKPPPPRLPRRISARRPRKPKPGPHQEAPPADHPGRPRRCSAIVSTFFGMMMAISQDLPQLENKKEFAEAKNSSRRRRPGQQDRDPAQQQPADPDRLRSDLSLHEGGGGRDRGPPLLRAQRRRHPGHVPSR